MVYLPAGHELPVSQLQPGGKGWLAVVADVAPVVAPVVKVDPPLTVLSRLVAVDCGVGDGALPP